MAIIPGREGLGEAIARPQRYNETQVPRAAFGGQLGQALYDSGAQQVREEQLAAKEAEADRKAANKAQALAEIQFAADDLTTMRAEFADGIKSGQIDKTKAAEEWTGKARERIGTALERVHSDHSGDAQRSLDHQLRVNDRFIGGAVRERDQADVRSGIDQTIEHASRLYATNPGAADQLVAGTLEALGPHSGLPPDRLARAGQVYREKSRLDKANALIIAGQRDNATLDKIVTALGGDDFKDIDPGQRTQLEGRIEMFRVRNDNQARAAQERIERAAERRLKVAEAAWNTGNKLAFEGVLNPAFGETLLRDMAGTPYAKGFAEMMKVQRQTGAIASQPPAQVQAAVDRVNTAILQGGITPELKEMRDRLDKVHDGQMNAIRTDGVLRAAGKYGVAEPPPRLDFSGGIPGAIEQLKARAPAVVAAAQWAGKAELLYPEEAAKLADMLHALPAKERAVAASTITAAIGPQAAQGLAGQINHKDRGLALAVASDATPAGQQRAEMILRGQQAKADGTSTKGEKVPDVSATAWRARAAASLEGVFGNAQTTAQALDAAELVMHGIASTKGGRLSKDDMEAAMHMAVGGTLLPGRGRTITRDGRLGKAALPLPEGMTEDSFDKRLRSVQPSELWPQLVNPDPKAPIQDLSKLTVRVVDPAGGYAQVPIADFLLNLPVADFAPYRRGEYAVIVNDRPVVNERGATIIIKVAP